MEESECPSWYNALIDFTTFHNTDFNSLTNTFHILFLIQDWKGNHIIYSITFFTRLKYLKGDYFNYFLFQLLFNNTTYHHLKLKIKWMKLTQFESPTLYTLWHKAINLPNIFHIFFYSVGKYESHSFQHNAVLFYADRWEKKSRFSMKAHQSTNVTKAKIPDLECGVRCQRIDTSQVKRSADFNESTLHKADPRHLTKICIQFMRTFRSDVPRIFLWKSLNIFIRIIGLGNQ